MKKTLYSVLMALTCATMSLAQDSPQWHLPDGAKLRLGKGWANEIAYSPDGTKLAVASGIGIWIYDAQTGEALDLFPANRFGVRNLAFSPDGKLLISDSRDSTLGIFSRENLTIRLWEVETGRQIRTFTGHTHPITCLAFSPDGKTIAGGTIDYVVRVWDVESGRQLHRLIGPSGSVTSVVFSPDSKTVAASGSRQKFFKLWDVETGDPMPWFEGHTEGVSSLAFHPDGKIIASGSYDNTVRLWNVDTGVEEWSFTRHTDSVYTVAFSPDGKTLASGGRDKTIWLWNVLNRTSRDAIKGHTDSIRTVVFGPDSYTLASQSSEGTIHLWKDITGNGRIGWEQRSITGHTDVGENLAFSPDGNRLVSVSQHKVPRLWDVNTGTMLHDFIGHTAYVGSVAYSPDGKTIASGSYDGTLRLWDADTGTEQHTLINIVGEVGDVAFGPEGKKVACTVLTGKYNPRNILRSSIIYLFDVETGAELHAIAAYNAPPPPAYSYKPEFHPTEHTMPVNSMAFSPHGNVIASSSSDGMIRLWHAQTGEHLRVLAKQVGRVYGLAFSPDGKMLAYESWDDNIYLLDIQEGTHLRIFTRGAEDLYCVAFSSDGRTLVSVAKGGTIVLWDVQSGMEQRTFPGHTNYVNTVAFSPDGSTLASGGSDGTVLLWDLNAPTLSNTTVGLSPIRVESPVIGEQLTLSMNIADGQNVAGYQATVHFDATTLRFVDSANGDYLPATAYVMPPVVESDRVMLAATSFAAENGGDGTLATITFEVMATKASTVSLSDVLLTDSAGNSTSPKIIATTEITEPMFLPADVNEDGVINVLDLAFIAANFGKTGKNSADVNRDGVVNIVDLTLAAAAIGEAGAAAPALWYRDREIAPTRANIAAWLKEARQLNLADPAFQRGIIVLERLLASLTPKETALLPNYPNPFNPETWIPYQLATPADVRISIYTADGKLVRQLTLGHRPVGIWTAHWNGKNTQGESVASGVYFYTLTAGQFSATRKMLMAK